MSARLLIIDPQNDFCDLPGAALPVTGADADMRRLAACIEHAGNRFEAIHVSLDSHHPVDIAQPAWWTDEHGEAPAAFTAILPADLDAGRWRARDPAREAQSRAYVDALAEQGRYTLIVWPEHCLIGSWGHGIHSAVATALGDWARRSLRQVDYQFKGMNPATEHYSALRAEVPDPADPASGINQTLLDALATADTVVIAGEALSHCVASTVRDIVAQVPATASRLLLLTDCCSPVPGFEQLGRDFIDELTARGMRCARSTDFLP